MIPPEIDAFLRKKTGRIGHSGRTLYDHLVGTFTILKDANALEHVCLAGLFHSIYGTNAFRTQAMVFDKRSEIADLIGERAERIAYIFCRCNRPRALIETALRGYPYAVKDRENGETIALTVGDLHDLLTIELANLVEQDSLEILPLLLEALVKVQDALVSDMRSPVSAET